MTKKLVICTATFEYMAFVEDDHAAASYADEASCDMADSGGRFAIAIEDAGNRLANGWDESCFVYHDGKEDITVLEGRGLS